MKQIISVFLFFLISCQSHKHHNIVSPKQTQAKISPKDVSEIIDIPKVATQLYKKPFDEDFQNAFVEMKEMLVFPEKYSFKRAVFLTENAYLADSLSYNTFNERIKLLASISQNIAKQSGLLYDAEDRAKVEVYAGVYMLMTKGVSIIYDSALYQLKPMLYDFEDYTGQKNWQKMFVSKVLETNSGNCHSLPFLYKILVEEQGEKAYLSLAPNHIYIKQQIKKSGWYNTELTSAAFPNDAWLMASGYIKLEAIQNGLYMKALDNNQSIAICLTDLAQGYERKFGVRDGKFIISCCDLALQYFPNYINALLLKAEIMKKQIEIEVRATKAKSVSETFTNQSTKAEFEAMQALYKQIHTLGYRKMPEDMYLKWLASLSEQKVKYQNNNSILAK